MNLEELKITAQLAMLDIPNPEKLAQSFNEMLEYFSIMMEVDIENLEPTTHALATKNCQREDTLNNENNKEELLMQAPQKDGQFFKIPAVL